MERRKCTREFNLEAVPGAWGDGGASRAGFWRAGDGVAPVGAGVCRRYVGDLSGPGVGEARAGRTRTAPPCSHQVKDGA